MDKYKIIIPEPCHENWDKMVPKENDRFCMSCSKTVIDFTAMLPAEIQQFFIQNQNEKICGRFRKSQLDTINIQIPNQVLYSQTSYRKMFLLALFVAMGTTLFSCQDKDGKKQKIDTVEVVKDTVTEMSTTVGDVAIDPNNTSHPNPPPPPPPKENQVKFVNPVTDNIKVKSQKPSKINSKKEAEEDNGTYLTGAVMQTNAEFPGGIDQFYNFYTKEFKKPEGTTSNLKIRISFAVEKNGSLSYIESEPKIEQSLEKEIIRVLSLSPKWNPGESGGKKIKMQYSLPIVLE